MGYEQGARFICLWESGGLLKEGEQSFTFQQAWLREGPFALETGKVIRWPCRKRAQHKDREAGPEPLLGGCVLTRKGILPVREPAEPRTQCM